MKTSTLEGFVASVDAAIAKVPEAGRYGRKVFVSAIWETFCGHGGNGVDFDAFRSQLIAAQRAQLLSLARADLVAAMPPSVVAASEISRDGATWHFVVDAHARDPWT